MRYLTLLALLILASTSFADDAAPAKPADPAEIARLIKQLDADKFEDREAATAALVKIDEQAKEAVEQALQETESVEVRTRATQVLKQLRIQYLQRNPLKLDDVYQMAREVSAGKAKPEELEPLVDRILEVVAATEPAAVKPLPVKISECKTGRAPSEPQALFVGEPNLTLIQGAAVVLDAGGRVTTAQNSVIIAWGAIEMTTANNCVIIAGADVSINTARNCLVLAGGELSLLSCSACTLGAGESITTRSFSQRNFVVNSKPPETRLVGRSEVVKLDVAGLVLREKPVMGEVLAEKLTPTFLSEQFMLFKVPGHPGEFVARTGSELLDAYGKPIPGLEGWKTLLTTSRFATFGKGDERTFLRFKAPAPMPMLLPGVLR